jgi:hypothetical protein
MISFLYSLSDPTIVCLFSLAGLLAMVVVYVLKKRIPFFKRNVASDEIKKTDDFLIAVRTTVIAMLSLVLAFSMVTVINNFNRADAAATAEAALINNMDRLMTRYGDPKVAELRKSLMAYTQSIVNDEWPLLSQGKGSDKTRELFVPISQGIIAIQPEPGRQNVIYTEMVKKADDIAEARESRIESTGNSLALIFWLMVGITFAAMIILTVFVDLTPIRVFGFGIQLAVFSALLSVVFIYDQPFDGQTSISTKAYVRTIHAMESRKK